MDRRRPQSGFNPITGKIEHFHKKHQPLTPEKEEKDLTETLNNLNLSDPERSSKIKFVNSLLQVWHSFQDYDLDASGIVSASEFRKSVESAGLKFGTKDVDKILLHIIFTQDDRVDYRKLEDYLDSIISGLPTRNPNDQFNDDTFTLVSQATNRKATPADDDFAAKSARVKELVIFHNHKIADAFLRYEQDKISLEDFLNVLKALGFKPTSLVIKVLRRKDAVGACSYTQLIQALSLPESKIKDFEIKLGRRIVPQTIPDKSPVKEPPSENPPKIRHLVNRPNSLRDSNILTWEDDPKKPKPTKKGNPSFISTEKQEPSKPAVDADVQFTKQEKINSLIRDFLDTMISGTVFRTSLKELGVEVNHEIDRLIEGYQRDGKLTFNELYRKIRLAAKGDVQYLFLKEEIPNTSMYHSNIDFQWDEKSQQSSQFGNTSQEAGITRRPSTATNIFISDQPDETFASPKRTPNRNNASKIILTNEIPREVIVSNTPPPRANLSTVNPTDHASPSTPEPYRTSTKVYPDKLEGPNVVIWSNPPYKRTEPLPPAPSDLEGTRRHYDRRDVAVNSNVAHPIAPFGTNRDSGYNVNPHHYKVGTRHPRA